ncbi:MAG: Lipoprotein LpqB beta-propeller domain, partial [Actinomycetota bacterium]
LAYTLNGELRTASVSKVKKYKSQFVDVQNSGYDNSGRLWFSNFRGNLFCLSTDGSIQKVLQLEGLRIQDLSVSPDGARVALIATTQSTSTLLVGSIVSENGILKVVSLHKVEQTLNEVSDVDWFNSTDLAVLGQIGISESVVAQVSLTNGSLRNLNGPRKFNYISTSNKGALLAGSNSGSVWMFEDGQWIKFAKNVQAVYSK